MTFLSILIALLLERITPQFIEFRRFSWLRDYAQWMMDVLHVESLGRWMGFALLGAPLLLIAWILTGLFENAVFGLFELAFNVVVLFLCLGPRDLDRQVDAYLETVELGDEARQQTQAQEFAGSDVAAQQPAQAQAVSRTLFSEANIRIYALLFWFVLLGPVAAVAYRLLEQMLRSEYLPPALRSMVQPIAITWLGWIDWLPTRLSLFAYMISGSFEDGLQAYRRGQLSAANVYEENIELLQTVGMHSLAGVEDGSTPAQLMEMLRKARGLVLRALVVWLLLLLALSFLA
jgi:membrane protein required for beta-lactamase induction